MSYKCFQCLRKNHTFSNCSKADCVCACVNQIYSFPINIKETKLTNYSPNFLKLQDKDIKNLLFPYQQISELMKIRKEEQNALVENTEFIEVL